MSLCRSTLYDRPVFYPHAGNAPKLSYIMRREDAVAGQGDPCNQHVVGADPCPPSFQLGPDDAGSFRGSVVQVRELKRRAELPAYLHAFFGFPAAQRAKQQLGNRYGREKDLFAVLGRKPLRNMNIAATQQLDWRCRCRADNSSQIRPVFYGWLGGAFEIGQ